MVNIGVVRYCGCGHYYGGHLSVCSLLLLGVDGVVFSASGGGVVAIVPMVGINPLPEHLILKYQSAVGRSSTNYQTMPSSN